MTCPSQNFSGGRREGLVWENCVGTIQRPVDTLFEPDSLPNLVFVLQQAETAGRRVKAVGSGWSFEDLAVSQDWMVDIRRLSARVDYLLVDDDDLPVLTDPRREIQLNSDADERLFHVEAGISLAELNTMLETAGLAMPTLPGAKGMTLAGAISTGTHGSDIKESPLADLVQAVHLVTTAGQEVWIESDSNPVTFDDAALLSVLPCPDTQIIRDDDALNAVRVSLGRFGVVYSYVLRVSRMFRLAEWAEELPWATVSDALASGVGREPEFTFRTLDSLLRDPPADLGVANPQDYQYLDIAFNPRRASTCWVRRRWRTDVLDNLNTTSDPSLICNPAAARNILEAAGAGLLGYAALVSLIPFYGPFKAAHIGFLAAELAVNALNPHITGGTALAMALNAVWAAQMGDELRWLLEELNQIGMSIGFGDSTGDGKLGPGWQLTSGPPEDGDPRANCNKNCSRGNAAEFVFGLDTRAYLEFMDKVLLEAPRYPVSGYVSLRFTRASQAYLSMHNVAHHMAASIEVITLRGLAGNDAFMRVLDFQARALGGRPHWGQQNDLRSWEVNDLYGDEVLSRWKNQLLRIAGLSPTFSNDFTVQRGLEPVNMRRQVTAVRKTDDAISHLCNDGEFWSPVSVFDAMTEIVLGIAEYFVASSDGGADATIIARRYVTTAADDSPENNLGGLPIADDMYGPPPVNLVSRRVTSVIRATDSGITRFLCNDTESWCVNEAEAYAQINAGTHEYYITDEAGARTDVETREYLSTRPDLTPDNNLLSLPSC